MRNFPLQKDWTYDPEAAYLSYVDNETIGGVEFNYYPEVPRG